MSKRWGGITPELRIEQADGGSVISGYGAVYYRADDPGTEYDMGDCVERIHPGAFDKTLESGRDIVSCVNHDENRLLGRTSAGTLRVSLNRRGLRYEVPYDEHDDDHRSVKRKLEKGDITGSSFAFRIDDEDWDTEEGRSVRNLRSVQVIELGPVAFPAYKSAKSYLRDEDLAEIRSAIVGTNEPTPWELARRIDKLELRFLQMKLGQ